MSLKELKRKHPKLKSSVEEPVKPVLTEEEKQKIINSLSTIERAGLAVPIKVTRSSVGLVTKEELMYDAFTLELTYNRNDSNQITSIIPQIIRTKVQV